MWPSLLSVIKVMTEIHRICSITTITWSYYALFYAAWEITCTKHADLYQILRVCIIGSMKCATMYQFAIIIIIIIIIKECICSILPFRVDPFLEGHWWTGKQTGSHKSSLLFYKSQTIYQVNSVPITSLFSSIYALKRCESKQTKHRDQRKHWRG